MAKYIIKSLLAVSPPGVIIIIIIIIIGSVSSGRD